MIGVSILNKQLVWWDTQPLPSQPTSQTHMPSVFTQALNTRANGRPASIESHLSSLGWLCPPRCLFTVQSGAWHWSVLTAQPLPMSNVWREKSPFSEPRISTYWFWLLLKATKWRKVAGDWVLLAYWSTDTQEIITEEVAVIAVVHTHIMTRCK